MSIDLLYETDALVWESRGDAFPAAFLVADQSGAPPDEALRYGVAAGTAVLLSQETALLSYDDYAASLRDVTVTALA